MNELKIAVCDTDFKYAESLTGAISEGLPFEILGSSFTDVASLAEYSESEQISFAVITQSAYDGNICETLPVPLMVLRETPDFAPEGAILIDRFQSREELIEHIIKHLPDGVEGLMGRNCDSVWKVIGIYSPVRRCLQTTFALSLGQLLGGAHKTLYMNFEKYSGLSGWMGVEFASDMTDLMYYYDCDPSKLSMRIPLMVHHVGDLDMLPPAPGGLGTYDKGEHWVDFLKAVGAATDYEYLILDLSDAMGGLYDVMEYCNRIYTCVRGDAISRAKLAEYEKWMVDHSRAEVMAKSVKFSFPEFHDLPERPDMLTQCELAGYVRSIINEDEISA